MAGFLPAGNFSMGVGSASLDPHYRVPVVRASSVPPPGQKKIVVFGINSASLGGDPSVVAMDFTDPTNPTVLDTLIDNAFMQSSPSPPITAFGTFAYAVNTDTGTLIVIDASDPTNLTIRGTITDPVLATDRPIVDPVAVTAGGVDHILIAAGNTGIGLVVFEVTDPDNPAKRGTLATVNPVGPLSVSLEHPFGSAFGPLVYLTDQQAFFQVVGIEIDDFDSPVEDDDSRFDVNGENAIVATRDSHMIYVCELVDVTDPRFRVIRYINKTTGPTELDAVDLTGLSRNTGIMGVQMDVLDDRVAVVTDFSSAKIIQVSSPTVITVAATYTDSPVTWLRAGLPNSDLFYVVNPLTGVDAFSVANPANPQVVGTASAFVFNVSPPVRI